MNDRNKKINLKSGVSIFFIFILFSSCAGLINEAAGFEDTYDKNKNEERGYHFDLMDGNHPERNSDLVSNKIEFLTSSGSSSIIGADDLLTFDLAIYNKSNTYINVAEVRVTPSPSDAVSMVTTRSQSSSYGKLPAQYYQTTMGKSQTQAGLSFDTGSVSAPFALHIDRDTPIGTKISLIVEASWGYVSGFRRIGVIVFTTSF